MFSRIFTFVTGHLYYVALPIHHCCQLILLGLGVHGSCDKNDLEKYRQFKATHHAGVIVYNHPTFYDHVVLMKELGEYVRFVMLKKYMVGPIRWLAKRLQVVEVKPKSGVAQKIRDIILHRKPNESLLAINPAAGHLSETDPTVVAPFRTGAFLAKAPVLPILLWYDPYEPWKYGESLLQVLWRRLRGEKVHYMMKVLDPMTPTEDETVVQYAERCRKYIGDALLDMRDVSVPRGSIIASAQCFATSHLFFLCTIVNWWRNQKAYALGMLVVSMTSVWYHGFGTLRAKMIDTILNVLMGTVYSIRLLYMRNYRPIVWLWTAVLGYILRLNHALFVHIPITIGFLSI